MSHPKKIVHTNPRRHKQPFPGLHSDTIVNMTHNRVLVTLKRDKKTVVLCEF